jgi:Lon protease-like protein
MALLPERLPLLPVRERVLLPSSVLRVVVASPRSLALVAALLSSREPLDGLWVGVLPLLPPGAAAAAAAAGGGAAPQDAPLDADGADRLHSVGCAARVLQISRFPTASRRCVAGAPPRGRTSPQRAKARALTCDDVSRTRCARTETCTCCS